MAKLKTIFILCFCCAVVAVINSCAKQQATGIDKELLDMAKDTTGFTWFQHSDTLLHKSPGSTHPKPWLRTRFNSIASTKLDGSGRIMEGTVFPEGSLIVKEMYGDEKKLAVYTCLYKKTGSEFADKQGWVWGAVTVEATVAEPAANKGVACKSCHAQDGNIDFMLMNKFFP